MYARQAIQTTFIQPTNTRPSRVKAFCEARAIVRSWDDSLNVCENHHAVALELAKLLGWSTKGCGFGALPKAGYALVFPVTP
jgi:hypothetical protein